MPDKDNEREIHCLHDNLVLEESSLGAILRGHLVTALQSTLGESAARHLHHITALLFYCHMTTQHQISSIHPPTTSTGPATNIPTKARCSEFTRQIDVVFWCTSLRLTNPQLPFCPAVFISPITLVDPHVVSYHL